LEAGTCDDVFADVYHFKSFAGDEGSTIEAVMADVFAVEAEASAVLEEIFRMGLSETIQSRVALEITAALTAAVGIDILIQARRKRGFRVMRGRHRHAAGIGRRTCTGCQGRNGNQRHKLSVEVHVIFDL